MTNSTDQTGSTQIKQIYPEIRYTHMYRQAHVHLKTKKNAGSPYLQLNTQAWSSTEYSNEKCPAVLSYIFIQKWTQSGTKGQAFCFSWLQEPLKGLIWLFNAGKRPLSPNTGCRKILKKKNKRTTVENSQEVSGKESCWTLLPLQELLCASPWSIVLPPLQVDFLQIVIAVHSHIFQRIKLRNVRVRFRTSLQFSLCHGVI